MSNQENKNFQKISSVDTKELPFDIEAASKKEGLVVVGDLAGGDYLPSETGDFIKWSKASGISLPISILEKKKYIHRRSIDIWLPVMWIGQNALLPVVTSLIAAYVYEKSKGLLSGEKATVKFSLLHKKKDGTIKRFDFSGDSDSLSKLVEQTKKLDLENFFDD